MITPQLTEQYGQVDRVSVVRAIFSSRSCASAGARSKPSIDTATPPMVAVLRKSRRLVSMADAGAMVHSPDGNRQRALSGRIARVSPVHRYPQPHHRGPQPALVADP